MAGLLILDSSPETLRYRLVDEDRGVELASGAIEGIGMPTAALTHTVRVIAEPGVPSVTMVSETATTSQPIEDRSAAVDAMLSQFAQHGPPLPELAPRVVGDDDVALLEAVRRGIRGDEAPRTGT